jgi:anti-anti-sigma factor
VPNRAYEQPDSPVVTLSGEYGFERADELRTTILAAGLDTSRVMVDAAEVTFLDSSGLRALIEARHGLEDHGIGLSLVNVSPAVRCLLQVTAMERVFGVAPVPS